MTAITPATHQWKSLLPPLKKCRCGKQTTGQAKNLKTGKSQPLCSDCAYKKGFR